LISRVRYAECLVVVGVLLVLPHQRGRNVEARSDGPPGWVEIATAPGPGYDERVCARYTPWTAIAELDGGELKVSERPIVPRKPLVKPPFPVATRLSRTVVSALRLPDGWLVSRDDGEWGGTLSWFDTTGTQEVPLGRMNVRGFVPEWGSQSDAVLVLEGLAHLNLSEGSLAVVRREPVTYRWQYAPLARLPGEPDIYIRETPDSILIVHDKGVARFTTAGELSQVFTANLGGLEQSSIVKTSDGDIYVGMQRYLVRARPDGRVSWYVPAGCERFTAIEPRGWRDPDCVCQGRVR